jgi:hypothetical protein
MIILKIVGMLLFTIGFVVLTAVGIAWMNKP